jgi:hypothetical protein
MGTQLSADITRVTPAQLLAALARAWRVVFVGTEPKRESLLVLLAQWALETGEGSAMHAFNLGNVKSIEGDGRDFCAFPCWEMERGQKVWYRPPHPATRFRAYRSLDEGAIDYLKLLSKRFARAWPAVLAGDPEAFAHELKLSHYYTADESAYAAGVRARFNRYARTTPSLPPPPGAVEVEPEPSIVTAENRPIFIAPEFEPTDDPATRRKV